MNPYAQPSVIRFSEAFYNKYYSGTQPRTLILGINPGRFGAGITGIAFTDPVKLNERCDIPNDLPQVKETSAGFIWDMIDACGGPETFFNRYLLHSVCPLGFTKEGVNYNYYDDKALTGAVMPLILETIETYLDWGANKEVCYCLGQGKNFKFFEKLNSEQGWFGKVEPLPHPRWIVQYRRKKYDEFIRLFSEKLFP
ncbi:MAG: SMUG2 DNA glycosylase family protein [Bacteroidales bacterium]